MIFSRSPTAKNEMMRYYLGISLVAGATLMLELTFTRLFSFIFFNHFAFLIISTALFGLGLSGVILSIFPFFQRFNFHKMLMVLATCLGFSVIVTLKIVLDVPLQFGEMGEQPVQYLYLVIYFLALALPFFFSGAIIVLLLSNFPEKVNKLYFADLVGAGLGCLAVILLVPMLGAPGTVLLTALLGLIAAIFLGQQVDRRIVFADAILFVALIGVFAYRNTLFQPTVHEAKRDFKKAQLAGEVEFSKWGPVSRIDVTPHGPYKIIWIDGGTNQGFMVPFNGNVEALEPDHRAAVVYRLVKNPEVLVVGPAGGEEVFYALSYRPRSIIGVELDPVIVDIVQGRYREYIGAVFNQPNVELFNDEGRSFIRRSTQKYDIIQQIKSASPFAIASGAVNLSETYLITIEAFHEYLDHLKEGGFIYIQRPGAIRLAVVAAQVLRARGVTHPEERIIIMHDPLSPFGGGQFILKNGDFTEPELETFREERIHKDVIYGPKGLGFDHPQYQEYLKLIASPEGWKQYYTEIGIDISPVTDDRPFFNHFTRFLRFDVRKMPAGFDKSLRFYKSSDFILLAILAEAALLSGIFIILPLYLFKRSGLRAPGKIRFLLYFSALGMGFILIEIAFIQKFTLFMGNPNYSVAVVLFAILTAAGCGSFLSGKFRLPPKRALAVVVPAIAVFCGLILWTSPMIFKACLGYSMAVRVLIAILLIAPLALLMGMPFPFGIALINQVSQRLIPWVWGINGYATVIGSVLCVILALIFGFRVVIFIAAGIYLAGFLSLMTIKTAGP